MTMILFKNIKNVFAVGLLCLAFLGAFVSTVSAQTLDVQFEQNPLFSNMNIAPGFTVSRTVTVTNNSTSTEEVYVTTRNEAEGGLEDVVQLTITDGSATYFNNLFSEFFNPDPISLGTLAGNGTTRTYTFTADFDSSIGNAYQDTTMGFDLVVGFENGESVTDTDGGGGGNGENISLTETDDGDDDDLPPGQIAGESTTTPPVFFGAVPTAIAQPFIDFVQGVVLGDTASATTSSSTDTETEEDEQRAEDSVMDVVLGSIDDLGDSGCTFLWLVLLVAISLSWSLFEDVFSKARPQFGRFFVRNIAFGGIYLILLVLVNWLGLLGALWWLFAGVWAIFTGMDYFLHKLAFDLWSPQMRNIYFFVTFLVLALLGYFTPVLCVWVPFALISGVSAALLFADR